jgi:hypothetical protein
MVSLSTWRNAPMTAVWGGPFTSVIPRPESEPPASSKGAEALSAPESKLRQMLIVEVSEGFNVLLNRRGKSCSLYVILCPFVVLEHIVVSLNSRCQERRSADGQGREHNNTPAFRMSGDRS